MRPSLKFPFPRRADGRPLCIAHRGASAHAKEGTPKAYDFAADLGSDMWEIDIWLSSDGVPLVSHDPVQNGITLADHSRDELHDQLPDLPDLNQTIEQARERGQALYLDLKAKGSGAPSVALLLANVIDNAVVGAFDDAEAKLLIDNSCPYPVSVLVRAGEDPFERARATYADIIHLCWEHASDRPQDLVTPDLINEAQERGLGIVLWHEERPDVLADLVKLPVLGICTDNPELMGGFHSIPDTGIEVVCHRGINHIAPENTMASAHLTYDFGCDWLELDVRETADGEIMVLHDDTLDRTTSGTGKLTDHTRAALADLDAGSWKDPHWHRERIPHLSDSIALAKQHGKKIYIENKSVDPQKLLDFVVAHDFLDDCFFWSPNPQILLDMRALSKDCNIKSNIVHHGSFERMVEQLQPQICEIQVKDWEVEAPLCREHGIRPMLQYFGSDPEVFAQIATWRPEMINLDRADMLLAALKEQMA